MGPQRLFEANWRVRDQNFRARELLRAKFELEGWAPMQGQIFAAFFTSVTFDEKTPDEKKRRLMQAG